RELPARISLLLLLEPGWDRLKTVLLQSSERPTVTPHFGHARRLNQPQAHQPLDMGKGMNPVGGDPGISISDHDTHQTAVFQLYSAAGHIAATQLVDIQVFLPDITDLENPVFTLWRVKFENECLMLC